MSFKVGKGQTEGLFILSNSLEVKAKEVSQGELGGGREQGVDGVSWGGEGVGKEKEMC